jgi:hypothetical protein
MKRSNLFSSMHTSNPDFLNISRSYAHNVYYFRAEIIDYRTFCDFTILQKKLKNNLKNPYRNSNEILQS